MTQPQAPNLNKCGAAAALTGPARAVHLAVLASFTATGQPPARNELGRTARSLGADPDAVLAELSACDVIAFGASGEIRAAYPFSPTPTAIELSWAGGPAAYAMCAIDALGISAMLGRPVTITAAEPGTGRVITVHADGDKARWNPESAVVFAGATRDESCHSADRTCGNINFFTSSQAARDWADQHPAVTGMILGQAQALAMGVEEFGAFMRTGTPG
jgi:alkylmercury lyase-like protein